MVILKLLDVLPGHVAYKLCMDNYFTSLRLYNFLGSNNIRAIWTVRVNSLGNCPIANKKETEKKNRVHIEQRTTSNNDPTVVAWKDNKVVFKL